MFIAAVDSTRVLLSRVKTSPLVSPLTKRAFKVPSASPAPNRTRGLPGPSCRSSPSPGGGTGKPPS
jgi:hypothetical protein